MFKVSRLKNFFQKSALHFDEVKTLREDNKELRRQLRLAQAHSATVQIMYREMAKIAFQDPLTGLPNYRALKQYLTEVQEETLDNASCNSALIAIDMNNFKQINDTFGHEAGDEALKVMAKIIRSCVRKEDLAARRSGDEFIVVLRNCNAQDAILRAEQIKDNLQECPLIYKGENIVLTCSLGIHELDKNLTVEQNMSVADHKMYADKKVAHSIRIANQNAAKLTA